MEKEEFYKFWRYLLVDLGISETEASKIIGASQQSINRKAKEGTMRVTELVTLLEHFNKKISIERR